VIVSLPKRQLGLREHKPSEHIFIRDIIHFRRPPVMWVIKKTSDIHGRVVAVGYGDV
jgi:hypothetical protein